MSFSGAGVTRHWASQTPLSAAKQRRSKRLSTPRLNGSNSPMAEGDPIRIIPHRGVDDDCGSVEVWFADGRKAVVFYWDNLVSRRMRSTVLTRQDAIEKATALARAEMDKMNPEDPE